VNSIPADDRVPDAASGAGLRRSVARSMGKRAVTRVRWYAVALIPLLSGCALTGVGERDEVLQPEQQVVKLVNLHRQSVGLSELRWDNRLARIARSHSEGIAAGARPFDHSGLSARAREALLDHGRLMVGENLFSVQPGSSLSVWRAVAGWLESPPHRAQLEGCYDYTGVGIAVGTGGQVVYTQLFARRMEGGRRSARCILIAGTSETDGRARLPALPGR
jgi:uncharacterized protein YkwD